VVSYSCAGFEVLGITRTREAVGEDIAIAKRIWEEKVSRLELVVVVGLALWGIVNWEV